MCVLSALQRQLEDLHGVDIELAVSDYVVDEVTRALLPGAREGLPEQLFVREDADFLELALYIDPSVVAALENDHPHERLHPGNLNSYCVALEGVSHFVYLVSKAQAELSVSILELEIQAEVDKFVTAWLLMTDQSAATLESVANPLMRQFFERYELHDDVPAAEIERYHTANQVALRYCRHLARRYSHDRDHVRLKSDLRRFYRKGLADKMRAP